MTDTDSPLPSDDDQALRAKRMRAYTELGLGLRLRSRTAAVSAEEAPVETAAAMARAPAIVREPLRTPMLEHGSATPAAGATAIPPRREGSTLPQPDAAIPPQTVQARAVSAAAPAGAMRESGQDPLAGLEQLQARVAACQACGLCKTRKQTVFAAGNPLGELAIVGEAPGAEEDRTGQAFVGNAGKLLDNMLASLALNRQEHAYICNVIKCRPPENRDPEPEEVARCEVFLQQQLGLVRPRIILVVGRFAAQSLLRTDASIASLRGRVHAYAVEGRRVPVVVTYHPAYLLRNLGDKAKAWADLCLLKAEMARLTESAA